MAFWHGYVLVELSSDVPPVPSQAARARIRAALRRLNRPWKGIQPARRFQARESLDGRKAIYEITVDDLGHALDRALKALPDMAKQVHYTFFAYGRTWQESRTDALHYLAEHAKEWERDDDDNFEPPRG